MPSLRPRPRDVALVLGVLGPVLALVLATGAGAASAAGTQQVSGELVQAWPEHHDAGEAAEAPLSWIAPERGPAVRVPTGAVADLLPGSRVTATVGATVPDPDGDGAAGRDVAPAREVLASDVTSAAPAPGAASAPGTEAVTIALVAPAGTRPDATTTAELADVVDGPVARFWSEQTGGAVSFAVADTHGWTRTDAPCSDPVAMWDEAAAAVGFEPGPGRHLLLYVPAAPADLPGCSYGLAEVGHGLGSGGRAYVRDVAPSIIAHELGHNLGLGHSSERRCDGAVDAGRCHTVAYGDWYDVMGVSWDHLGSLNAAQRARLGVLPAGAVTALDQTAAATDVRLTPLGGTAGTRALRLTARDGTVTWLEYRAAVGRDAWLGRPDLAFALRPGVLVHRAAGSPDTSLLLDATPTGAPDDGGDTDVALPAGVPVQVAGFTVTLTGSPRQAATVHVQPADAPGPVTGQDVGAAPQVLPGAGSPCDAACLATTGTATGATGSTSTGAAAGTGAGDTGATGGSARDDAPGAGRGTSAAAPSGPAVTSGGAPPVTAGSRTPAAGGDPAGDRRGDRVAASSAGLPAPARWSGAVVLPVLLAGVPVACWRRSGARRSAAGGAAARDEAAAGHGGAGARSAG